MDTEYIKESYRLMVKSCPKYGALFKNEKGECGLKHDFPITCKHLREWQCTYKNQFEKEK